MKAIAAMVAVMAAGLLTACGSPTAAQPPASAAVTTPSATASASATGVPSDPPLSSTPLSSTPQDGTPQAVTVVSPKTLVGRSAATEHGLKDLGRQIVDAVGAPAGGIKASGIYGSTSRKDAIVFVAVTGSHPDPNEMLDAMVSNVFTKNTFHPVDPGSLGGAARCTAPTGGSAAQTICMWADPGSFGLVYFLYSAAANADRLLAQARGEVELPR